MALPPPPLRWAPLRLARSAQLRSHPKSHHLLFLSQTRLLQQALPPLLSPLQGHPPPQEPPPSPQTKTLLKPRVPVQARPARVLERQLREQQGRRTTGQA